MQKAVVFPVPRLEHGEEAPFWEHTPWRQGAVSFVVQDAHDQNLVNRVVGDRRALVEHLVEYEAQARGQGVVQIVGQDVAEKRLAQCGHRIHAHLNSKKGAALVEVHVPAACLVEFVLADQVQ